MSQLMKMLYETLDRLPPLEGELEAVAASKEAVRAAEQHLTYSEFENLWNAISDIEHGSAQDAFTLGFRMGMQLTLEGLRPITPAASAELPCPPQ